MLYIGHKLWENIKCHTIDIINIINGKKNMIDRFQNHNKKNIRIF